jgi:hypothetical protein
LGQSGGDLRHQAKVPSCCTFFRGPHVAERYSGGLVRIGLEVAYPAAEFIQKDFACGLQALCVQALKGLLAAFAKGRFDYLGERHWFNHACSTNWALPG